MKRVAVVTGGTRGIGEAISMALQSCQREVAATYVADDARAADFSARTGVKTYRWDVADYDACQAGIAQIEAELGPVEILVNNAGVTRDALVHKMPRESWHQVIDTNLTSSFNMVQAVLAGMRERKWGRIVTIGSINGQAGQFGQVNYSAAKAGLQGFTRALALETAKSSITANLIAPGYIETDMVAAMPDEALAKVIGRIPAGRLGQPHEIARAVAFLTDEDAGYITGSTLSINGGQHMAG